jgi:hypothetical protein
MALGWLSLGCGSPEPQIDDAPFREAIAEYLDGHNMAMKIKQIKQGPTLNGQGAELEASLVHQELSGPAVTWTFYFVKQSDGQWSVQRHED